MNIVLFFTPEIKCYKLIKHEHAILIKKTSNNIIVMEFIGSIRIYEITTDKFNFLMKNCNDCFIIKEIKKTTIINNITVNLNCSTFIKHIINADRYVLTSIDLKKYLNNNFKSNWFNYTTKRIWYKILSSIFNKNEKVCYFILLVLVRGKERLADLLRTLKLFD